MVKKLLKYEFISYLRTLVPMYIILLAIGTLNRFIQIFENEHFSYNIVFSSSVAALVVASMVCGVMTMVMGVVRFHKNLYTSEGYLSFTLPVTTGQHIFAKLVMVIAFTFIGLFVIFTSASIAMLGDVLVEAFRAIGYILKEHLGKDDEIVAAIPVRNKSDELAIFTSLGMGKKFANTELPLQKRAGKGLVCYKPTDSTGNLIAATLVSDEDNILILGDKNSMQSAIEKTISLVKERNETDNISAVLIKAFQNQ